MKPADADARVYEISACHVIDSLAEESACRVGCQGHAKGSLVVVLQVLFCLESFVFRELVERVVAGYPQPVFVLEIKTSAYPERIDDVSA